MVRSRAKPRCEGWQGDGKGMTGSGSAHLLRVRVRVVRVRVRVRQGQGQGHLFELLEHAVHRLVHRTIGAAQRLPVRRF
jgi:hypothetical protein